MISYLFVSLLTLLFSFVAEKKDSKVCCCLAMFCLAVFSGVRGPSVGIDTEQYYYFFSGLADGARIFWSEKSFLSICSALHIFSKDPAFLVFVFSFCTNVLIVWRLWTFRNKSSFFVMVAVYLAGYYPESMNVMRQFFAVSLVFAGSYFLERNRPLFFIPFFIFALNIHASSVVSLPLLIAFLWQSDGRFYGVKRLFLILLSLVFFVIFFSKFSSVLAGYSKYFETMKQSLGFMLIFKFIGVAVICYITRFGFCRMGGRIVGCRNSENIISLVYAFGLILCSLGMFFPFVDRIALFFLMFEMPFWGWCVKSQSLSLAYKCYCGIFIFYLYIMNLITDGQHIFPYVTIWG